MNVHYKPLKQNHQRQVAMVTSNSTVGVGAMTFPLTQAASGVVPRLSRVNCENLPADVSAHCLQREHERDNHSSLGNDATCEAQVLHGETRLQLAWRLTKYRDSLT